MPPMPGMSMGPGEVMALLGPDLAAACHGDLAPLGLAPETLKAVEDKRFELQKRVIRTVADLRVLRLDLGRILDRRDFDLAAAQQKVEEITAKEGELRTAHLGFLFDLRSSLTDEQWHTLHASPSPKMDMGGRMPMMGGSMPCGHGGGEPLQSGPMGPPSAPGGAKPAQ